MKQDLIIGIDPGVKTGYAEWLPSINKFLNIQTFKIHNAFVPILERGIFYNVYVVFEDARKRKWYGANSNSKIQGAGSVKRDCKIWEDFLTESKKKNSIKDFKMVHPQKGMTKIKDVFFKELTKYNGRTSEHARDASMLVFNSKISLFKK